MTIKEIGQIAVLLNVFLFVFALLTPKPFKIFVWFLWISNLFVGVYALTLVEVVVAK